MTHHLVIRKEKPAPVKDTAAGGASALAARMLPALPWTVSCSCGWKAARNTYEQVRYSARLHYAMQGFMAKVRELFPPGWACRGN